MILNILLFALLLLLSNNPVVAANSADDAYQKGKHLLHQGQEHDSFDDFYKSIAYFNEAINLNPKFAKAYNARGSVHSELGEFREAVMTTVSR